jgi:hypothetical protein
MKPSIVNWIYVGLVYVLFDNVLSAISNYLVMHEMNNYFIRAPYIDIISAALAITAMVKLIRKSLWTRIVSIGAICLQILSGLGISIYIFLVSKGEIESGQLFPLFIILDIPLIFLAYKIYSSNPLKVYLGHAE